MKKIPCVMIRGRTLRGTLLLAKHLPEDQAQCDKILMVIMDSGNDLKTDGIGGDNPLTSEVAIISRSSDPRADVDYLFAQVIVHEQRVDTTPSCGNMLPGAGAFAIENGLIAATSPVTRVRIRNIGTGTFIEADVQTPNGVIEYEGSAGTDDVSDTTAPVVLTFLNTARTKTEEVFPTDSQVDYFDNVPVTCIDTAIPVIIIPAGYPGETGCELPAELDADRALLTHIESIRLQAGKAIGLGDVNNMATPKPVFTSPTQKGGVISVCYFMPHLCHRALAMTNAITISNSCTLEDTVIRQIVPSIGYGNINTKHSSGVFDVHLNNEGQNVTVLRASVIRMTRKISSGKVYPPRKNSLSR